MIDLPEIFSSCMEELLGADAEEFFASYNNAPVRGLNFKNESASENIDPRRLVSVPWCKTGRYYAENERPAKTIAYHAGLFYIQEPSAMCPAEVLGVEPGMRVLDLCAAPGGKSVQIAGHLRGEGLLVSNDASATRCRALVKNLERAGVTNAVVLTEQPVRLAARFAGFFDRILVDAPCSGEGMFRRDPDAIKAYTANKPEACAAVQAEILRHAAAMLKPGGRMVYSTCTFNRLENEDVIEAFLEKHDDFSHVEIDHAALCVQNGFDAEGKTARIFPHLARGEGHFIALLEKPSPTMSGSRGAPLAGVRGQSPRELEVFELFRDEFLRDFPDGNFFVHDENLFLQPFAIELGGLRVARSGWFLGEIKKDRFVPSQALAMGIGKEQSRFSVELGEGDAWKYLRGESLFFDGAVGKPWVLVCYENCPLGWARAVQGRLKNHLPTGWVVKEPFLRCSASAGEFCGDGV